MKPNLSNKQFINQLIKKKNNDSSIIVKQNNIIYYNFIFILLLIIGLLFLVFRYLEKNKEKKKGIEKSI